MEVFIAFLAGWFLSWPGLVFFLCVGTIFEANEAHGWAVFTGLVAGLVAYTMYSVPLAVLAGYAVAYFIIGFIWSFWRYKRHADKVVEMCEGAGKSTREYAIANLKPSRMLGNITTWVFIWPFSMVENVLGDFIKIIQSLITKFFKGIYNRIYDAAVGKILADSHAE